MNHIHVVAVGAILAFGAPKKQGVDSTIDKAVETYTKTRTSKGTFEQAITNPLTGSTVKARWRPLHSGARQLPSRLPLGRHTLPQTAWPCP